MPIDPVPPAPSQPSRPNPPPRLRLRSEDLFRGGTEIVIVHGQEEYLLRLTRNGKLILTK